MCGIVGYWDTRGANTTIVAGMASLIQHRGPDGEGTWLNQTGSLAMAHRRLAVVDLSTAGHQPMTSSNGRYVLVYNGEVYNFSVLREQLIVCGIFFRGHSDTEVILASIEVWGLESAINKFVGMFAFALWDKQEQSLHLVRDRLGIKPLYYGWVNGAFVFGSELKAIKAFPGFNNPIDRDSLALMMRHNNIPAPYSIYQDIYKLKPGHILSLSLSSFRKPKIASYWSAEKMVEMGSVTPFKGSDDEAIDQLDALLREIIGVRMVADVPLGAFLSGGYDSSMVVAQMQAQSNRPVKTFSIGFHEQAYNEAQHARVIAKHLQTEHTELYVSPEDAMAVIPNLATLFDEPFADSSQIPTYLVSKLARKHVTVSLSGDGGDELFGGYGRYFLANKIWNKTNSIPSFARSTFEQSIRAISPDRWSTVLDRIGAVLPAQYRFQNPGDKLYKLAGMMAFDSREELYKNLTSNWPCPSDLVLNSCEPVIDSVQQASLSSFTEYMMYSDLIRYMPDDILTKVDRASMGVSLEARVPLIDHRLVEFAWQLPLHMKVRNGEGKWILKQVLDRYIPREMMERPKMGFGIPIDEWLRGPLRDWAEDLLNEKRLESEGFFNVDMVRSKWNEHLYGTRRWHSCLWNVLMFQAWLEENS